MIKLGEVLVGMRSQVGQLQDELRDVCETPTTHIDTQFSQLSILIPMRRACSVKCSDLPISS